MHRTQIADILHDNDSTWDSEQMEEARTKWTQGDFAGALTSVQSSFSQEVTDIDAEVERRVADRLRESGRGVDSGSSTAAGQRRLTLDDAANVTPGMSDDQLQAHADLVLDQFFNTQVRR
jgi:hypothetical protein